MSTRVNGTSLQTAINNANQGDILSVASGGYAGGLSLMRKDISIFADSQAILDGPQRDGKANFDIDASKFDIRGLTLQHGGAAFRITGDCRGAYIGQCSIPIVDWMMRNTPSPTSDDNGGNAFQLTKREGVAGAIAARNITIEDITARQLRAKSSDYNRDGGKFEIYGGVENITIRRSQLWDSVNILEVGKGPNDPINRNILVEDSVFHGRPAPLTPASDTTVANGMYVRSVDGLTIQRCEFDQIDWWSFVFQSTGGFASGGVANVKLLDNVFRLAPGVNRIIATDAGVPVSSIQLDRSRIYVSDPNTTIAKISGTDGIKTLAQLRALAPLWEVNNAFFGKEPPANPCAAQVDAAVRDADARNLSAITAANAAAAAAQARADSSEAQLAAWRVAFDTFVAAVR